MEAYLSNLPSAEISLLLDKLLTQRHWRRNPEYFPKRTLQPFWRFQDRILNPLIPDQQQHQDHQYPGDRVESHNRNFGESPLKDRRQCFRGPKQDRPKRAADWRPPAKDHNCQGNPSQPTGVPLTPTNLDRQGIRCTCKSDQRTSNQGV